MLRAQNVVDREEFGVQNCPPAVRWSWNGFEGISLRRLQDAYAQEQWSITGAGLKLQEFERVLRRIGRLMVNDRCLNVS